MGKPRPQGEGRRVSAWQTSLEVAAMVQAKMVVPEYCGGSGHRKRGTKGPTGGTDQEEGAAPAESDPQVLS